MPYQDDPSSDQDFQFARKKSLSARDRKRELELKIQNSMSTLQGRQPTNSSNSATSFHSYGTSNSNDCQSNPQHPLPDSQHHFASSNPHPSAQPSGPNSNAGILGSVLQCVGTAIQVGASELVPTNLYQNMKSAMTTSHHDPYAPYQQQQQATSSNSYPFGSAHHGSTSNSYQHGRGSYGSTLNTPSTLDRR